jgi:tetratricopeptide (TPR) repeat protein
LEQQGAILGKLNRFETAIVCFDKALEINSQDSDAWYMKAYVEGKLARKREVLKSYRKFIELAPAHNEERVQVANKRLHEIDE